MDVKSAPVGKKIIERIRILVNQIIIAREIIIKVLENLLTYFYV